MVLDGDVIAYKKTYNNNNNDNAWKKYYIHERI